MKKIYSAFFVFTTLAIVTACSSSNKVVPNPLDKLTKERKSMKSYSIILNNMDVRDTGFFHKYDIVQEDSLGEVTHKESKWHEVDEKFFRLNENNLGMELASKDSIRGASRAVAPAGYSNYVGNERYGSWHRTGNTFMWIFFARYAFMNRPFGMGYHPAYRSMHSSYRTSYYRNGKTFYGSSNGKNYYGTNSAGMKKGRPGFFARKSMKKSMWNKSRSSRSSSRGSGRSRGFGFGK